MTKTPYTCRCTWAAHIEGTTAKFNNKAQAQSGVLILLSL